MLKKIICRHGLKHLFKSDPGQDRSQKKKIADRKEREAAQRFTQMCADAGGGDAELGRELLEKDGVFG